MKLEAEETIQFEGIKPTFWFESDSCVKTKQVMWLDQNGIWWVVKAWPELNFCVDYDFLFTGCCIFRPSVFEAEAVLFFFLFFGVSVYRHRTPGQTANSEADKHTRMIIITHNTGHAYLLLSFFSLLFVD